MRKKRKQPVSLLGDILLKPHQRVNNLTNFVTTKVTNLSKNPVTETAITPLVKLLKDPNQASKGIQDGLTNLLQKATNVLTEEPDKQKKESPLVKTETAEEKLQETVDSDKSTSMNKKDVSVTKEWVETASSSEIEMAIKFHNEGVNGDKSSVHKAYDLISNLYEKDPDNPTISAYYGSTLALMGRDEDNNTKRMKYVLKGLNILDSVVDHHPDNVEYRLLRGNVCYKLPEMYFHRTDTAISDFEHVVYLYGQDPKILTKSEYETIIINLIKASETLNKTDDANHYRSILESLSHPENNDTEPLVEKRTDRSNQFSNSTNQDMSKESLDIYNKALQGNAQDVQNAINYFSSLEVKNPRDPLIKAYSIDAQSLLGRDSINTFEMFSSGIKAMKALTDLVNENPKNVRIKKLRAMQSFRLPEAFFKKTASAIKDFEDLIKEYEKDSTLFTTEEYLELLFNLGEGYQRIGMNDEAILSWNKLLKLNPPLNIKNEVESKLKIVSFKPIQPNHLTVSDPETLYSKGKELHAIGANGSKQAAQQALEVWEKAVTAFPDDHVAKTYYAASVGLMAKYADEAQGLFGDTIKATKLLKSAFNKSNETAELLLLRGNIYNALPEAFFHKTDSAIKDLKAAKQLYEQGDQSITEDQYLQLLVDLANAYERSNLQDKAEKTWSLLAKKDTNQRYKELLERKEAKNE